MDTAENTINNDNNESIRFNTVQKCFKSYSSIAQIVLENAAKMCGPFLCEHCEHYTLLLHKSGWQLLNILHSTVNRC